jgi:hypothetical protein
LSTDLRQYFSRTTASPKIFVCLAILPFLFLQSAQGQTDSSSHTVQVDPKAKEATQKPLLFAKPHSPKKAALYSALIPGLGQGFNHKYWKIPVIYAAGVGLGYFFYFEENKFAYFTDAYHQSVAGNLNRIPLSIQGYSTEQLLEEKGYYNRYRDLAFIGCAALYLLNVVDAAVDAHLYHFKDFMSDDLSLRIRPSCLPVIGSTLPAPGLRLSFSMEGRKHAEGAR